VTLIKIVIEFSRTVSD